MVCVCVWITGTLNMLSIPSELTAFPCLAEYFMISSEKYPLSGRDDRESENNRWSETFQ